MNLTVSYLSALTVFLAVDAVWIRTVMRPIFERHVGAFLLDAPRLEVAAGFYAAYVAAVLYFAVSPGLAAGSGRLALLNGVLLGFVAYGTYEATNLATLKGWTYGMLAVDIGWGMFLTGITAVTGFFAYRWISG